MDYPHLVHEKIIISGQYVEHYKYDKPYWVGIPISPEEKKRRVMSRKASPLKSPMQGRLLMQREDNVRRTRTSVRRLVNSNQNLVKFATLTFKENITDLNIANPLFNQFIKRITRRYPDFRYLAVPEFQKRGAVHYHLLCNLPFLPADELTFIWGHGFCFIRKVDSVDNMGAYICKYIGKENFDPRYFGKRKFFYSYNLNRPLVVDNLTDIAFFMLNFFRMLAKKMAFQIFEISYCADWVGMVQYSQYKSVVNLKVVPP